MSERVDQRMAWVEGQLDHIDGRLGTLASKNDVKRVENAAWNALGVGGGIAVVIIALFVGILAYLQDQRIAARPNQNAAAASLPVIIQLPPWPSAPTALPSLTPPPAN